MIYLDNLLIKLVFIVFIVLPGNSLFGQQIIYLDPKQPIDKRVEDLLSRMTLEEKLGQLNMPFPGEMAKDLPGRIDACLKFAEGKWVPNIGPAGDFGPHPECCSRRVPGNRLNFLMNSKR